MSGDGARPTRVLRNPPWWTVPLVSALLVLVSWTAIDQLREEGRDLQQDYVSAQRVGSDLDPYDTITSAELDEMGVSRVGIPANAHPPTSIVLFLPFRFASFATTAVIWSAVSIVALVLACWLAARLTARPWLFWGVAALGWWYPLQFHLRFGQWSTLILLGSVLCWLGLERRDDRLTGLPIALVGAIKVVPFALVVVPLLNRRFKSVLWAFGGLAAITAVSVLVVPSGMSRFLKTTETTDEAVRGAFGNGSAYGLVSRAFGGNTWVEPIIDAPSLIDPARVVVVLAVVALAALGVLRTRDLGLQVALVSVTLLLVSPVTWRHSDVILLLPAIVVLGRDLPRRTPAVAMVVLAGALTTVDHFAFTLANRPDGEVTALASTANLRSPGPAILLLVFAACLISCGSTAAQRRRSVPAGRART